ncbi:MAG: winged helix-turn-helix domain-containing protein [Candidatus Kapaibacterium sp.]
MLTDVYKAIALKQRRDILELLAKSHEQLNISQITAEIKESRQTVTKNINILAEEGLIELSSEGREKFCKVNLEKLNEVSDWFIKLLNFWDSKLSDLEKAMDESD